MKFFSEIITTVEKNVRDAFYETWGIRLSDQCKFVVNRVVERVDGWSVECMFINGDAFIDINTLRVTEDGRIKNMYGVSLYNYKNN